MAKPSITIRLDPTLVQALDEVSLQTTRSRVIETIVELFLAQDFARQRRILKDAMLTRRHRFVDRWPRARRASVIESAVEPIHISEHERLHKTSSEARALEEEADVSRDHVAEARDPVAIFGGRDQKGG